MGLDRGDLVGVDGYFAVLLWREYCRTKARRVLETLLAYNVEDAVNLESLLVQAYNLKLAGTPFAESHRLPMPSLPEKSFLPDMELIDRLRDWREKAEGARLLPGALQGVSRAL